MPGSLKTTLLSLLVIFIIFVGYVTGKMVVENIASSQNILNLNSVSKCAKKLTRCDISNVDEKQIVEVMNICAKNVRSIGQTGDMFVIRKSDAKIVWDASQDCSVSDSNKAFLTKEGVCKLFTKPDTCKQASYIMRNEPPRGTLKWTFDDSEEIVNYLYLACSIDNDHYILGCGAQTDEIITTLRVFIIPVLSLLVILLIVISV